MANNNEIGAKIVLTGDASGAKSAIQGTTDEVKKLHGAADQGSGAVKGLGSHIADAGAHAEHASDGGLGKLKGSLTEFAGQVPGASGALNLFGEVAEAVEAGPLAVLALAVAAAAGAVEALKRGIEEYAQTEAANTKLDQALAQSGDLTDSYREKLQALSGELQETTGIADEKWAAVLARLTQFGATPETINENAEAVKNLAGIMGGDIEAAGAVMSKVINGNYLALHRLGIEVDKNASQHEQLESVYRQLAQRGGGQLEQQTKTIAGNFVSLGNATADLFKGFGNLVSRTGLLQVSVGTLTEIITKMGSVFPNVVKKVEGLENKTLTLDEALQRAKGSAQAAAEEMNQMGGAAENAGDASKNLADHELDELKTALEKISEATRTAITDMEKLQQQQDRMENAQLALDVAKIKAGPGTDEDKLTAERDVRKRYGNAKQARADAVDAGKIGALRADTDAKNKVASDAEGTASFAKIPLDSVASQRAEAQAAYDKNLDAIKAQTEQTKHDEQSQRPDRDRILAFDHDQEERLERQRNAALKRVQELDALKAKIDAEVKAAEEVAGKARKEAADNEAKNAAQIVALQQDQKARRFVFASEQEQTGVENAAADAERRAARAREDRAKQRDIDTRAIGDKTQSPDERAKRLDAIDASENADLADTQRKSGPSPVAAQDLRERQLERRVRAIEDAFKFRQQADPHGVKLTPEQEAIFDVGLKDAAKGGLTLDDNLLRQLAAHAASLLPSLAPLAAHGEAASSPAAAANRLAGIQGVHSGDGSGGGLTTGSLGSGGTTGAAAALAHAPSASDALAHAPSAADALAKAPDANQVKEQAAAAAAALRDAATSQNEYHQSVLGALRDMHEAASNLSSDVKKNTREIDLAKSQIRNGR